MTTQSWTRFGKADLSNCEREQIHLAGSIQPHGALLVLDPEELTVQAVSENLPEITGVGVEEALGARLDEISPGTAAGIRDYDRDVLRTLPHAVGVALGGDSGAPSLVGHVHESPDGRLVLELEPRICEELDRHLIADRAEDLLHHGSYDRLFDETTRLIRAVTGYDRVMVYRFDEDGHGAIVAEAKEEALESFLGNHYPASDIPQIARALYLRNRTRILVDVEYDAVPIVDGAPLDPEGLDMSLCQLRSMSPIHLQYLKNMGVSATLVASLVIGDDLWGLIACHHYSPKRPGHSTRAVCELIAELTSTRILAIESAAQASVDFVVRRFEQRMVESIGRRGEWMPALMDADQSLLECVDATGAALVHEGRIHTIGEVPSTPDLRTVADWIAEQDFDQVFETHRLAREPKFEHLAAAAAGVMAARISPGRDEMMLWFRPEQVRMVTWGGDPNKPVEVDSDDPADLSPRRSFEAWHQLVERTSAPWTRANRAAARAVGESISDVILQFRSVRILMAHQQITEGMARIDDAGAPLFIADARGRRLVANVAFRALVGEHASDSVEDLAELFVDPAPIRSLSDAPSDQVRSWRGRVELDVTGGRRALLLRADPIYDRRRYLIGTIFLFIDLLPKEELESARRRFQRAIVARRARFKNEVLPGADEADQRLFYRLLDNANVAALEVVAGMEMEAVPDLLRSIEVSITRASDLLEEISRARED